jgi:CRISPR-associated endonuclease/helicase Cas3
MRPQDFDKFFHDLYGYAPFPWQTRLARQVAAEESWPCVLNLPTSAGKTAVIDIAIFGLALQAGRSDPARTAPLRTFFVIDRRIVVDEAYDRSLKIVAKLRDPNGSHIWIEVAKRLRSFSDGEPLHVARLRGGMYRDNNWAKSPAQPTVCISTVDQVGSRLLFRGYGVSEYQRPLHAGLVSNDSLIIVDEAHLSRPFLDTLESVERYRGENWAEVASMTPFRVVRMSATLPEDKEPFELDPVEDYQNEELGRRLRARKLARRVEIAADSPDEEANRRTFAAAAVHESRELAAAKAPSELLKKSRGKPGPSETVEPVGVVGIVVNRVATARMIHDMLSADTEGCHVILLTGRIRPYDRDELLYGRSVNGQPGWFRYMAAEKNRPQLDRTLFVVATQTVEVGANISFDALVTEAAPLDSLRQRFGRLDRLGLRGTSHAVIIARKDTIGATPDAIYRKAVTATWKWLKTQQSGKGKGAAVDFGLLALKPPTDPSELRELCCPRELAPVMLPAHVDTWVQTSPTPAPDPDVSLFLHGPASGPPDVQIVWRADLPRQLEAGHEDDYITTVALVPPTTMEALPVPIYAARAWLAHAWSAADFSDVEGEPAPVGAGPTREQSPCLLWRGPEESKLITPDQLHPGDTIIVPALLGGADKFGWKPASTDPVRDVGDICSHLARRVPTLRLHEPVLDNWECKPQESQEKLSTIVGRLLSEDEDGGMVDTSVLLKTIAEWAGLSQALRDVARQLLEQPDSVKRVPYPNQKEPSIVLIGRRQLPKRSKRRRNEEADHGDFTNEDDTASLTGEGVASLTEHCGDVRRLTGRFGKAIGLPGEIIEDLGLAGWLHDAGKADLRFQAWLLGGDRVAAEAATELFAKSGISSRNRSAILWARERAGYPKGGRHEYLSVALVARDQAIMRQANDFELVLHLIGSHHGRGRPLIGVVADDNPEEASLLVTDKALLPAADGNDKGILLTANSRHQLERLDSGWTDRFWKVVRRYGWWGIALLEAVLQLADHRSSEEGCHGENNR